MKSLSCLIVLLSAGSTQGVALNLSPTDKGIPGNGASELVRGVGGCGDITFKTGQDFIVNGTVESELVAPLSDEQATTWEASSTETICDFPTTATAALDSDSSTCPGSCPGGWDSEGDINSAMSIQCGPEDRMLAVTVTNDRFVETISSDNGSGCGIQNCGGFPSACASLPFAQESIVRAIVNTAFELTATTLVEIDISGTQGCTCATGDVCECVRARVCTNSGCDGMGSIVMDQCGVGTTTQSLSGGVVYHYIVAVKAVEILIPVCDGTATLDCADSLTITFTSDPGTCCEDCTTTLNAVRSCLDHNGTELCLDMTTDGSVEPRQDRIKKLEFDVDTGSAFCADAGDVTVLCEDAGDISTSSVDTVTRVGNTYIVTFDPALPDKDACTVTLPCGASTCVRILRGDTTRNGTVTTGDLSAVRFHYGETVTEANAEFDYNQTGTITTSDFSGVRFWLNNVAESCP